MCLNISFTQHMLKFFCISKRYLWPLKLYCSDITVTLSTDHDLVGARNEIQAHAQWRVVTVRNVSTLTVHSLTTRYSKIFEVFGLCVSVQNSVAPTNNKPVIPSLASSPPHCAIHAPKLWRSSRGLSSVQRKFVLFIITVKIEASKLHVNTTLLEMNKPKVYVLQSEHIQDFLCVCVWWE
jgi:hypothetical protein